jgi:hypothetical protein
VFTELTKALELISLTNFSYHIWIEKTTKTIFIFKRSKIAPLCISIELLKWLFFVTGLETLQTIVVEMSTGGSAQLQPRLRLGLQSLSLAQKDSLLLLMVLNGNVYIIYYYVNKTEVSYLNEGSFFFQKYISLTKFINFVRNH